MFSSEDSSSSFTASCNETFPLTYSPINGSSFQLKFSPLKSVLKTPDYLKISSDSCIHNNNMENAENEKDALMNLVNVFSPVKFSSFNSAESPEYRIETPKAKPDVENNLDKTIAYDFGDFFPCVTSPLPVFSTQFDEKQQIQKPCYRRVNRLVVKPGHRLTLVIPGTYKTPMLISPEGSSQTPSPFDSNLPQIPRTIPVQVVAKPTGARKKRKLRPQTNDRLEISEKVAEVEDMPKIKRIRPNTVRPPSIKHLNVIEHVLRRDIHSCLLCGQVFQYKSSLREHILCIHTENSEKPYFCYHCGKGFVREGRFNDHLLNHRGIKAYSCALCCVRFTSKDNAIKHVEICTGAKEYTCVHCSNVLPSHSSWYQHMNGSCPVVLMADEDMPKDDSQRASPMNFPSSKNFDNITFSRGNNFQRPVTMKKTIIYLNKLSSTPL